MSASKPLIFYELVTAHGPEGHLIAANTAKTRLSLLHKGVPFECKELTIGELRALSNSKGIERLLVPSIELADGTLISDSFKIAQWLEQEYPDKRSLFVPESETVPSGPAYDTAVHLSHTLCNGWASSDPGWSTFFELVVPDLADKIPDKSDREYFTSDYKLGMKDAWQYYTSLPQDELRERARACLIPFDALLEREGVSYLASATQPGFLDFAVYGRYHMTVTGSQEKTDQTWGAYPRLMSWVERLEERFDIVGLRPS